MRKMNFLLVEDEALLREGLRALLEKESFVRNIYEASDAEGFKSQIRKSIDFVLMDFRLVDTNGLELLALLKNENIQAKVIMLTGLEGPELLMNLLKAGVDGIVYKLDGYNEITTTINEVVEKGSYFSPRILQIIQENSHRWDHMPPVTLTPSERGMLKAIASGLTTKEIAPMLELSDSTAETYRIRLIKKVGVLNTAGMIAYAYRNGIL